MYKMIATINLGKEVQERIIGNSYRSIEEARTVGEAIKEAIAYRIYDKCGLRVYTKRKDI
jgi:hypothetical protein